VDLGGYFSFQVGDNNRMSNLLPDASDESMGGSSLFGRSMQSPGSFSGPDLNPAIGLIGCELRAALGGYRSSTVILGSDTSVGQVDVGTILLQPIARVPGTLTSATNLGAPKAARKALDRAQKAFQKNKLEDAEKNLKAAVEIYPKYAAAWLGLGQVYGRTQRMAEAREAFTNAISADDKFVRPYIELARLAAMEKKWREVADATDRALSLDPLDFPEGFFFNALAHYQLNERDAAERSARKALRLDSQHRIVQAHLLLANILEQKKDFEGAMEQLRLCLEFAPKAPFADSARARLEELERTSKAVASKQPEE
jgi:tetratricopeptide (TPR) repeat protein